ncbi:uncharacterized protein [Elaeis guineensis]|uniref:uncharacterized protein isoform X2 n=1 Tax=Elaeis guineensis var. tenera TaxID=51953 RepID=UPI003C6CC74B
MLLRKFSRELLVQLQMSYFHGSFGVGMRDRFSNLERTRTSVVPGIEVLWINMVKGIWDFRIQPTYEAETDVSLHKDFSSQIFGFLSTPW